MERFDFASIVAVIRSDLTDGSFDNQMDFLETLFASYLDDTENYFDMGLVSKWLNGLAKPSAIITQYYQVREHRESLCITIEDAILPNLSDSGMVVQNVQALLVGDSSISEKKKTELLTHFPCETSGAEAAFLTDCILFGLVRPFAARDIRKPNLLPPGGLSPLLADYVCDEGVPKPCRYFCGRDRELSELHDALLNHSKVFLSGIAGIGKSELAKAYAKAHKKEYTNILYLTYTGDLKRDIANLPFADDLPSDSDDELFRKHNRFLRTLKEDTLFIIDNFNTTSTGDSLLSVILKYRCRILFTTRSKLPGQYCLLIEEIDDVETLFELASRFYADAEKHRGEVEAIIETVHRHTLAVELAARLLETGILEPDTVLAKLREERAAFSASDKINISKDGKASRATYYDHIHTLFALFKLSDSQAAIIRSMSLVPFEGIPARLFGRWMAFEDLNDVNELVELGFIQSKAANRISLHQMMQEVAVAELKPTISNCHTFLESIRSACQRHGEDSPFYKTMFLVIENVISVAEKDDTAYYFLLLGDVFQYMEKYQYENDMKRLIEEMETIIKKGKNVSGKDKAILLSCRAVCEKKNVRAIKLLQEALTLLPEITPDNALLVSNLNSNLGGLYRTEQEYDSAKIYMEEGIRILREYDLLGGHDSLTQFLNYTVFLAELGQCEKGLAGLRRIQAAVLGQSGRGSDYAFLLEAMGIVNLFGGNVAQARECFSNALEIFGDVWTDEPNLVAEKERQFQTYLDSAGQALFSPMFSAIR